MALRSAALALACLSVGLLSCQRSGLSTLADGGSAALNANPLAVDFGGVEVGTSATQAVAVTNSGGSAVRAQASGEFAASMVIPAGTSASVVVTFTPTGVGPRQGQLTLSVDGAGALLALPLRGVGRALTAISVEPKNAGVGIGAHVTFAAQGLWSDGTASDLTSQVSWSSSNSAVANAGSGGQVDALAGGSATVAASRGAISGSTSLRVVTSLTLSPRNVALTRSQTAQFTASATLIEWSVDGTAGGGAAAGTISPGGLYAPAATDGVHTVTARSGSLTATATAITENQPGVFQWHGDLASTGQTQGELALTSSRVDGAHFGRLFTNPVDGMVYAQPVYVANLPVGSATRDVVYVATEHDTVYAFDADAPGVVIWQRSFIDPANGVTTVSSANDLACDDLVPEVGITGTPAIDPATSTLYLVARTKENGQFYQRLHALDLATGAEKLGGPVALAATVADASGPVSFDPLLNNQRPGLALANGNVYIAFSSHCDQGNYHGWLLGYDAKTLQQIGAFVTTPNGQMGGIWNAGASPAIDSTGNLFISVANGTYSRSTGRGDYGQSYVRLTPDLQPVDSFTPYNADVLSQLDQDVGSGGVVLLPDQPGPAPHLLVSAGKEGRLYLVNRDAMGGFNSSTDNVVQEIVGALPKGLYATGAYWNGHLFFVGAWEPLMDFAVSNGQVSTSPVAKDTIEHPHPGTTPVISVDDAGNAVVWTLEYDIYTNAATLRAYDAKDISQPIFDADGIATGAPIKFSLPIVANGKVYFGTQSTLEVFGLLP